MALNRISGLVVTAIGLLLLFWIIPRHTETVDFGWLRPSTLPNITAVIVTLAGIIQFIFPTGKAELSMALSLRVGFFFILSLMGLGLMFLIGFKFAAPLLMLAVMLIIGERRIPWIIAGVVLLPAGMWLSIEVLLDWPLP